MFRQVLTIFCLSLLMVTGIPSVHADDVPLYSREAHFYYKAHKLPPTIDGTLADATAAYEAGDFKTAALIWTGHALQDDPHAALNAALAYFKMGDSYKTPMENLFFHALGEGVPEAEKMLVYFYENDLYFKTRIDKLYIAPRSKLQQGIVLVLQFPPDKKRDIKDAHYPLQFCIQDRADNAPCTYWLAKLMLNQQSAVYNPQKSAALMRQAADLGHWGARHNPGR